MIYTEKLLETLIKDSVQYKDIAIPSKETDKIQQ